MKTLCALLNEFATQMFVYLYVCVYVLPASNREGYILMTAKQLKIKDEQHELTPPHHDRMSSASSTSTTSEQREQMRKAMEMENAKHLLCVRKCEH